MPLCRVENGKMVCGPQGAASALNFFSEGVPQLQSLPDIEEISSGVMGREANMRKPGFLSALGTATDVGVRQIAFYQALSNGIPRVGGQFFHASKLSESPLLEANPAFLDEFRNINLTNSRGGIVTPEHIFDGFGRGMGKVFGGALSRLTGDALKTGAQYLDMFNDIWDTIPMDAIPVIGSIIKGFVKLIVNGVASQGRAGELDRVYDLPEFNPDLDLDYARDIIHQLNASNNDLTPIWSPPGPVLDDIDSSRFRWNYGFDDLKMKDKHGRTWWGFGSVNEFGYEPKRFAPYANSPADYGATNPLALGAIPGIAFIHSSLIADESGGYDLGKLLPTAGNIAGDLWFQVASPAGPQIWRIWPDKLFDRWVKYLSAMRRAIHLTYVNTAPTPPRNRILSTPDSKGDSWSYHLAYRKRLVNAGHEVFGWKKWGSLDDELFNKSKGGNIPDKSLDYYAENFGIYQSLPIQAIARMKINQEGAATLVTAAYARPDSPALSHNSDLRNKIDQAKRDLLTSEKLHLIDEDMVQEPELARAIREAKSKLAQVSMFQMYDKKDPDQGLEIAVRGARLRDMLINEDSDIDNAISAGRPSRSAPESSKKKRSKKSSAAPIALAAGAIGLLALNK